MIGQQSLRKFTTIAGTIIPLAIGFAGVSAVNAGPFQQAAGKYAGSLKGKAKAGIFGTFPLPKTAATVKLPSGKGRIAIRLKYQGQPLTATGRIDDAKIRQGGQKVILKGKANIPAKKTFGLGTVKGPFTARVTRGAGNAATVRGSTTLKNSDFVVRGNFSGNK